MNKISFKKMTQNNERNHDYVLCHPRNSTRENYLGSMSEFSDWIPDQVRNDKNSGFTVLFAVIVSSLILALGLGIVAITMKEVKLSGAGRDSQLAFYAADSGSECAMYHDLVKSVFSTSTSGNISLEKCNNQIITATASVGGSSATTTFQMCMEYDNSNTCVLSKPCVDVFVIKTTDANGTTSTSIDARGYNTCEPNHPRRLERGYRIEY